MSNQTLASWGYRLHGFETTRADGLAALRALFALQYGITVSTEQLTRFLSFVPRGGSGFAQGRRRLRTLVQWTDTRCNPWKLPLTLTSTRGGSIRVLRKVLRAGALPLLCLGDDTEFHYRTLVLQEHGDGFLLFDAARGVWQCSAADLDQTWRSSMGRVLGVVTDGVTHDPIKF